MAESRKYVGMENIALTNPQKQTLADGVKALGPVQAANPAHLMHWRTRLDNNATIFEAIFDDSQLTVAVFTNRLAAIFGVPAAQITSVVTTPSVGTVAVFSYQAVQRVRIVLFGGASATYEESKAAAQAYLAANAAAWEGEA